MPFRRVQCRRHRVWKVVTSYQEENDFVDAHEDEATRELGGDREDCRWQIDPVEARRAP